MSIASLWAAALPPRPAGAEGAIALGQTDSISADGLAFGAHYNDFDPNRIAGQSVAECALSQASETAHKACKIIGTFHDRCFALAQDAKLNPHGVGLSLAETRKAADALAMDQCRKMTGAAGAKTCAVLRDGCDGEAAFRGDPIDATGFKDRAYASLNKRDYDHAAADFGMVIKLDPQNAVAYNDRAAAYKLKGDLDHALADYEQAIALDPKYADAYNNRGTVHLARKEFDLAMADFNMAIALNGQKPTPYINLGLIYDAKGDYDGAIAQFSKAIAIDPPRRNRLSTARPQRCQEGRLCRGHRRFRRGDPAQSQRRHAADLARPGAAQERRQRRSRGRYRRRQGAAARCRPEPRKAGRRCALDYLIAAIRCSSAPIKDLDRAAADVADAGSCAARSGPGRYVPASARCNRPSAAGSSGRRIRRR